MHWKIHATIFKLSIADVYDEPIFWFAVVPSASHCLYVFGEGVFVFVCFFFFWGGGGVSLFVFLSFIYIFQIFYHVCHRIITIVTTTVCTIDPCFTHKSITASQPVGGTFVYWSMLLAKLKIDYNFLLQNPFGFHVITTFLKLQCTF